MIKNKKLQTIIFILLFSFLIFLVYFGLFNYQYIYPIGGDTATHITLIEEILEANSSESEYTPGMHILISTIAMITGTSAISVTLFFVPFLLVLCFLAVFLLTRYVFGFEIAILSVIIMAFISKHPYWTWSDGSFVNIITAEFLMFVFFYLFLRFLKRGTLNYAISAALIFVAMHVFHLLSFMYVLAILITFTILFFAYHLLKRKKIKFLKNIGIFYLIIFIFAIIPAWFWYLGDYFAPILLSTFKASITSEQISSSGSIQGINIQAVPTAIEIIKIIGVNLSIFALLSIFFLKKYFRKKPIIALLFFSWFIVFLIGASTRLSPDPIRIIRELALIANIFAAIFVVGFIYYLKNKKIMQYLTVIVIFLILSPSLAKGIQKYTAYQSQILPEDQKAIIWLQKRNKNN